jgi:hypothetical protein
MMAAAVITRSWQDITAPLPEPRSRAAIHEEEIMIKQRKVLCNVAVIMMAAGLPACGGGPIESEFIDACLKEGERGANKAFGNEMGINRDSFCNCAAKEAKSTLSADARRAMILDMLGKSQEASAISSKMSESEQKAFLEAGMNIFEKCAAGAGAK